MVDFFGWSVWNRSKPFSESKKNSPVRRPMVTEAELRKYEGRPPPKPFDSFSRVRAEPSEKFFSIASKGEQRPAGGIGSAIRVRWISRDEVRRSLPDNGKK